mmetsp:Transcript_23556/g.27027  ORF Transcript_23556/g.27027 Transcript_23556/m.27027 type:complete len:123 (+) Transcript_23556:573-941(+)
MEIVYASAFNLWNTIIESNPETQKTDIKTLLEDGLKLVSMSFRTTQQEGFYLFTDSQSFFTVIRLEVGKTKNKRYAFTMVKRISSGFDKIDLIANRGLLSVFTSGDKFAFIRIYDAVVRNDN